MDPTEFEDTVERTGEVLHAGALETLLHGSSAEKEKFTPFDIMKEASDIYLSLYNLQETLKKFPEVAVEDFVQQLDEKAMKIAEYKEDYLKRRKLLTATVKSFLSEILPKLSAEYSETSHTITNTTFEGEEEDQLPFYRLISSTKEIIDHFKKEYDYLSNTYTKFATDTCFLPLYRDIRDYLPESKTHLEQAYDIGLKAQDICKRAAEQFHLAERTILYYEQTLYPDHVGQLPEINIALGGHHQTMIEPLQLFSSSTSNTTSSSHILEKEREKLREELEKEVIEPLQQRHIHELLELKTSYERDKHRYELSLQTQYNTQYSIWQGQQDLLYHKKEEEIASLLQSIQQLTNENLNNLTKITRFDTEKQKNLHLEEKIRGMIVNQSDLESVVSGLQQEKSGLNDQLQEKEKLLTQYTGQLAKLTQSWQSQRDDYQREIQKLDDLLAGNPPKDLGNLCEKIGYELPAQQLTQSEHTAAQTAAQTAGSSVTWQEMESFIIDKVRKLESQVVSLRRFEEQAIAGQEQAVIRQRHLERLLQEKEVMMEELEKDLVGAHEMIQIQKTMHSNGSHASFSHNSGKLERNSSSQQQLQKVVVDNSSNISSGNGSSNTVTILNNKVLKSKDEQLVEGLEEMLLHSTDDQPASASSTTITTAADTSKDHQPAGAEDRDNNSTSNSTIIQSLMKQRDRYQRSLREMEQQMVTIQQQSLLLQETQTTLQQENATLYNRLRTLRKNGKNNKDEGEEEDEELYEMKDLEQQQPLQSRLQSMTTAGSLGSPSKSGNGYNNKNSFFYQPPYNNHNNRYHNSIGGGGIGVDGVAPTTILDEYLTIIGRSIFSDTWSRHAFFCYFLILHCCACMYIFQVLNPQLIEEVDHHLQAKWNEETFNKADQHPDIR